jgi:MoaA/NifB/PqqE/SkfB family radical SAM enzyme
MQYLSNIKDMNAITNRVFATQSTGKVMTFPEQITLMALQKCNYKCAMCTEWQREEQPDISMEVLEMIRPVLPFVRSLFITGGEPFMYKHLEDLFAMGNEAGCDLSMVTNGSLLDEKRREMVLRYQLRQLKISLDAGKSSTYKAIRGGNYYKVIGNILELAKLKAQRGLVFPEIRLGFVAMKKNIAELPKLVVTAAEIGVTDIFATYMGVQHEPSIPDSLYFYQEMSDEYMLAATDVAKRHGIRLELPPLFSESHKQEHVCDRTHEYCFEPWRNLFIRPTGQCNLCCGGGGGCGNLSETSFMEMWNHPARVHAREKVNSDNPPKLCLSCKTVKQNSRDLGTHFNSKGLQDAALKWGAKYNLLPADMQLPQAS